MLVVVCCCISFNKAHTSNMCESKEGSSYPTPYPQLGEFPCSPQGWQHGEGFPAPPPLVRQNALLPSDLATEFAGDDGSSPSTIAWSVPPPVGGGKKRKLVTPTRKTSTELMPPPSAPRKKRQGKLQLPILVLPDALAEKWVIEKGTFVIRPRSSQDYASMTTSATIADN